MRPMLAALMMTALPAAALADVPRVVTDTPVVQSLAAQVMGDLGRPEVLLDAGADPHAFQLRPSQARALSGADAVFWVGAELTPWLQRALDGVGTQGSAVRLLDAEGVRVRAFDEDTGADHDAHDEAHDHDHGHADHGEVHDDDQDAHEDHAAHGDGAHEDHAAHGDGAHEDHADDSHDAHDDHHAGDGEGAHDEHADAHGHDQAHSDDDHDAHDDHAGRDADPHDGDHAHGGIDPHAWLDPRNGQAWLGAIAEELASLDPDNAATYRANAAAAAAEIAALDARLADRLAPARAVPLVVFHDAYGYFMARYGLQQAGTIALGDAAAPGAARLADLRGRLADLDGACVFPEVQHDPALVSVVVEGTDARVGDALDPSGSGLAFGPGHYAALLTGIADAIADCATDAR